MKYFILFFLYLFVSLYSFSQQRVYTLSDQQEYDPSVIIVRLKSSSIASARGGEASLKSLPAFEKNRITSIEPALSYIRDISPTARVAGEKPHPLSNIYRITIEPGQKVIDVINDLLKYDEVIYAEPYFNHRPLLIPNDPEAKPGIGRQTYLSVINAYDAWTIEQGDTTVVIAVLDTGTELNHEDIKDNISYNYQDPINGVDDDGDGLVDNFQGWDIANNDNIPESDTDEHGLLVSGLSSATTNNETGIAGTGYKSRLMPIKIFLSGFGSFSKGYEAIALAADLGCQVINLSWGSPNSYSQFGQDIINYAVLEKNAAIVAAAGNTNDFLDFYPASYDNVISVGATTIFDEKPAWSTYSHNIDIVAPGQNVYSSRKGNSYGFSLGTSLSSPLVAGTLALLRARFPDLTAQQIMERVRVTADNIYDKPANQPFTGQMGKGRLNMLNALTDNLSPSVRITGFDYNNGSGSYAFYGDTLTITTELTNYLSKTTASATATLSSPSPYVTILDGEFKLGTIQTLGTKTNTGSPFMVLLHNNLPPEQDIYFRVDFNDGAYTDFQYFKIKSSPDYITLNSGNLGITVGSNGNLGYNKDGKLNGVGITFKGTKILENIGVINALSPTTVADNAPVFLAVHERSKDFTAYKNIKFYNNSVADFDARNTFLHESDNLDIIVEQKTLSWETPAEDNFKILEYRITNTGTSPLSDLHTAIFADWNLNSKDFNKADWDAAHNLGYVRDPASDTLYAGLALLSNQDPIYFAINNKNFNGNIADISTSITDSKKYSLVSQGIGHTSAGVVNNGNDVSHVLGGTITSLDINKSEKVAIAVVAGNSLSDLQNSVLQAQAKYQEYLNSPPLLYTAYTCLNTSTIIDPPQGDIYEFYSDINLSNLLTTGTSYSTPIVSTPQTYYAINKDKAFDGDLVRVIAAPKLVNTDFSISPSPLLLDETGKTTVSITDNSQDAVAWQWDFDNGYTATVKNPIMNFPETGSYTIQLTATNDLGCTEMTSKNLKVAYKSNKPNINNQNICKGESVTLSATNATLLKVYADALLTNEIFSGTSFSSGDIYSDTAFYITSVDSLYESNPKKVNIYTSKVKADFTYSIDTLNLNQKNLLHFTSKSENEALYYWLVDNSLAKVGGDLSFNYSDLSSFEVMLIAEDLNSCLDSLTEEIIPTISPSPTSQIHDICKEGSVTISPDSGQVFYFYSDSGLMELQHKGSSIKLDQIVSDTSIYITNIDSLKESTATEIKVNVSKLKAEFSAVYIPEGGSTIITNNSTGATSYAWVIEGDTVSLAAEPDIKVTQTGNYKLELYVKDNMDCQDSISHPVILEVVSGFYDEPFSQIKLYPNPTTGRVNISNRGDAEIEVLTTGGQLLIKVPTHENQINLEELPDGTYLIKVQTKGRTFYRKVVKE
ncbi:S8 family serine peptidase [Fulvivirga ulvae]|uniref:S8 family serine peptidase n=1 Tax=Fulvivirga ulvae TaxID=2904245 RepID=UPI001F44BFAF|nr:S8 family serine peptidase [Fulvivirga ulvae]UII29813.1 S8 family serine peptidase [Fulvivirga ulvae]